MKIIKIVSFMALAGLLMLFAMTTTTTASKEFKIVAVGDSIIRGYGLPEEDTFVFLGKTWLQEQFGDKVKVSAVNHAINGTDSDAILYNPALRAQDLPEEYLKPNGEVNVTSRDKNKIPIIKSTTTGKTLDNKFYGQLYRQDVSSDIKQAQVVMVNIGGNDGLLKIVDKLLSDLKVTYNGKKMSTNEAIALKMREHIDGLLKSSDPADREEGKLAKLAFEAVANEYAYDDVWASGIIAELDVDFFELFEDSLLDILKIKFGEDEEMIAGMKASLEKFQKENWEKIIDRIHDINPDANIIAYTTFNPYGSLKKIMKLFGSDLGEVAGLIGESINPKILSYAKSGRYYAVDTSKTFNSVLGLVLTDSMGADPHLNTKGHQAFNLLSSDFFMRLKADNSVRVYGTSDDTVVVANKRSTLSEKVPSEIGTVPPVTQSSTSSSSTSGGKKDTPADGSESRLKMIRINGVNVSGFKPNVYNYNVTVPANTSRVAVDADLLDPQAKFDFFSRPKTYSLLFGSTNIILKAQATNGQTSTYRVTVSKAQAGQSALPSEDLTLKTLMVDGKRIDLKSGVYKYRVETKKLLRQVWVTAIPNNIFANVVVTGNRQMEKGENLVTVTVVGNSGKMLTYRITVNLK